MYFSLLNQCVLVLGEEKGVIYNLKERRAIELDSAACELMAYSEKGNRLTDEMEKSDMLRHLKEIGWGFFSEHRYFIDKIRPYNHYTLTRPDLAPDNPQAAYLQLNHTCRIGAKECRTRFCTPCRCTNENDNSLTLHQWTDIVDRLYCTGVRTFFLTGGDVLAYEELGELCSHIRAFGIMPVLIVNCADERLQAVDKDIPLLIYMCAGGISIDEIRSAAAAFKHVTVLSEHSVPADEKIRSIQVKSTGIIERDNFVIPGVDEFYQRKDRDLCLFGRIFVKSNGDVVPCFQMGEDRIGNLCDDSVRAIVQALSEHYWRGNTKIDAACRKCEWFYACPVCKGMSSEKVCPLKECI